MPGGRTSGGTFGFARHYAFRSERGWSCGLARSADRHAAAAPRTLRVGLLPLAQGRGAYGGLDRRARRGPLLGDVRRNRRVARSRLAEVSSPQERWRRTRGFLGAIRHAGPGG